MKLGPMRDVLHQALEGSGKILREHFGRVSIQYKGRANLLTQADLESQKAILTLIMTRFPGHDFRAEEAAVRATGADFEWVIDPLDGTTNYAHGYPAFCVSIGLLRKGKPVLAGVYDPIRDELFTAEAGEGARLNGKPMRVTKTPKLAESLKEASKPAKAASIH